MRFSILSFALEWSCRDLTHWAVGIGFHTLRGAATMKFMITTLLGQVSNLFLSSEISNLNLGHDLISILELNDMLG